MHQPPSTRAPERPHLSTSVRAAFSPSGPLARALPGFEPRDSQRRMAEAVAEVVADGALLLAEAGTGTGKTLAYLIPAILSGHRTLVSTGTKNLQEQIFFKDLPALRRVLDVPFTATLMKGRSNYLCLHRLRKVEESSESSGTLDLDVAPERAVFLPIIRQWAKTTDTGDRAELADLPEDLPLWKDVSAEADTCLGTDCPDYFDCFLTRMRQRATASDVVIVNHHLLCADASVRQSAFGEVIPACPTLVVDEAHQLEDVATQYFGVSLSNFRIDDLVRDAQRMLAASGLAAERAEDVARASSRVADRARVFFASLIGREPDPRGPDPEARGPKAAWSREPGASSREPGTVSRVRYRAAAMAEHGEAGLALLGALDGLEATMALRLMRNDEGIGPPDPEVWASLARRAGELRDDLRFLLRADDSGFVYFVEPRGRGLFLRAAPIDVSRIMQTALFDRFRAVVLTSATLSVDESFDYIKGRLGIGHAASLRLPSEFDYTAQSLLYLPRRMPTPNSPLFAEAVAREAVALLHRSRGRAFVLFTSYRVLRAVQPLIEAGIPYPTLVQGSAPRNALIDRFRSTPHAVLLATSSFWQGIDVVGDSLSCVIIDKLPFASPADPITAARIEAHAASGGDGFTEYQVPLAILALKQGLGRLIRHRNDKGVLAILDPRLWTRGYGKRFLTSLPAAPVTRDLDAVDWFFQVD
jgi:ATP-dependent DNA helicase DinG